MGRMEEILKKSTLSESDVKLINRRLNAGKITQDEIFRDFEKIYRIDGAMNGKGYDYLMKRWRTPSGAERRDRPFGNREQEILANFDHFELSQFFNAAHYGQRPYYTPYWTVVAKDGWSFSYYLWGGEINITG